mmetsp:Transcript_27786/g.58184  ORF Transcript_27786/g.58184 Transcript_27786/m.58184 type:complete len:217 (-) Transcript_27786:677-1327(-)
MMLKNACDYRRFEVEDPGGDDCCCCHRTLIVRRVKSFLNWALIDAGVPRRLLLLQNLRHRLRPWPNHQRAHRRHHRLLPNPLDQTEYWVQNGAYHLKNSHPWRNHCFDCHRIARQRTEPFELAWIGRSLERKHFQTGAVAVVALRWKMHCLHSLVLVQILNGNQPVLMHSYPWLFWKTALDILHQIVVAAVDVAAGASLAWQNHASCFVMLVEYLP